jgi:hypothetical protein
MVNTWWCVNKDNCHFSWFPSHKTPYKSLFVQQFQLAELLGEQIKSVKKTYY